MVLLFWAQKYSKYTKIKITFLKIMLLIKISPDVQLIIPKRRTIQDFPFWPQNSKTIVTLRLHILTMDRFFKILYKAYEAPCDGPKHMWKRKFWPRSPRHRLYTCWKFQKNWIIISKNILWRKKKNFKIGKFSSQRKFKQYFTTTTKFSKHWQFSASEWLTFLGFIINIPPPLNFIWHNFHEK